MSGSLDAFCSAWRCAAGLELLDCSNMHACSRWCCSRRVQLLAPAHMCRVGLPRQLSSSLVCVSHSKTGGCIYPQHSCTLVWPLCLHTAYKSCCPLCLTDPQSGASHSVAQQSSAQQSSCTGVDSVTHACIEECAVVVCVCVFSFRPLRHHMTCISCRVAQLRSQQQTGQARRHAWCLCVATRAVQVSSGRACVMCCCMRGVVSQPPEQCRSAQVMCVCVAGAHGPAEATVQCRQNTTRSASTEAAVLHQQAGSADSCSTAPPPVCGCLNPANPSSVPHLWHPCMRVRVCVSVCEWVKVQQWRGLGGRGMVALWR